MSPPGTYRVGIVGLGRMSRGHLRAIAAVPRLQLVAVCDNNQAALESAELPGGTGRFAAVSAMMEASAPDIVVVVTPNFAHAAATIEIARHKPRAILCEKPMSIDYRDALAMVEACERAGVELLINHQRRLGAAAAGRRAIEAGAIGDLLEIEVRCAGDFLSDGTHAVDAALCLGGDRPVESVFGAVDTGVEPAVRYGHPVERSAFACWFDDRGVRTTVMSGDITRRSEYQSWRVRGTGGELWHPGGTHQPDWWISDADRGDCRIEFDEKRWFVRPVHSPDGGRWRKLEGGSTVPDMQQSLLLLVDRLDGGSDPHPLNARTALRVQEIVNACYLSALERCSILLPLPPDSRLPFDELLRPAHS